MRRLILALREAGLRFSRDGCAFLAQAVAFDALFALFPLVVLILTGASYVIPDAQPRVLAFFDTLAPELHDFIAGNLQSYIYGRGISSLVALAFLIWSGKNLFLGLAYALNRAIGVPKGRPLIHNIALSLVMLPIMGILLIVAMMLPVLLQIVVAYAKLPFSEAVTQLGAYGISLALVFVVCVVLYSFLPNRRLPWHFGIPGATIAALVWPAVQFAFAEYTLHVNFAHIYGALSAPLVLLLWFYMVFSIFLFGAEYCATWASITGTERVPRMIDVIEPANPERA